MMISEELEAAANGDRAAFERIASDFLPLVKSESNRAVRISPEFSGYADEIGQEALMALFSAVKTYDRSKQVTFGSYAKVCIRNRIVSYTRKLGTQLRRQKKAEEKAKNSTGNGESPEDILMAFESNGKLRSALDTSATAYERKVFTMYLSKKSCKDIAKVVGKDEKSVANAIYRVKVKLKKLFL